MDVQLQRAIDSFHLRKHCLSPGYVQGDCDTINRAFLRHAASFGMYGLLLALDNPHQTPTRGWNDWGGHWSSGRPMSHYVAYFEELELSVDFAARQFWENCEVPLIKTKSELLTEWNEIPFGFKDASIFEDEVA